MPKSKNKKPILTLKTFYLLTKKEKQYLKKKRIIRRAKYSSIFYMKNLRRVRKLCG